MSGRYRMAPRRRIVSGQTHRSERERNLIHAEFRIYQDIELVAPD